jgi:hypothetical protein
MPQNCGLILFKILTIPAKFLQGSVFALAGKWRISIFEQVFCSEGTSENSPAFQCRERFGKIESRRDG